MRYHNIVSHHNFKQMQAKALIGIEKKESKKQESTFALLLGILA